MSVLDYITDLGKGVPIRRKLLMIVLITTNLALMLAVSAVVFYDRQATKRNMTEELRVLTQVISQRSTAALAFDDKQLAIENLQTLSEKETIITACIFNKDGKLFGNYDRNDSVDTECPQTHVDLKSGFFDNYYNEFQTINLDKVDIGYIYIKSTLDEINERLIKYIVVVAFIFVVASFVAFLFALKLQKIITTPIHELASVSRTIYDNKDYSIRVEAKTNDEMGHLVEAFNDMLSGIEERDEALVDAKNNLEHLVKERTRKLKEAQNELIRNERMATLGQLTATVSHEIRNPLGTIRTSMFTLSNKLKDKDSSIENIIERIERNIVRCDNIITELLDYSRIRALNHEKTNLNTWIRSVVADIEMVNNVDVKLDLNESVDIEIDQDLLHRVMINVIENACQSMEEAEVEDKTLLIECGVNNSRTEIIITDTGPGIPDSVYPHIFEPLYSTKGFGIGLGLPIVKQIMEQHGGGIEVSSEDGVGTRVVLWLPSVLNFDHKKVS